MRWVATALAQDAWLLIAIQLGHAASFGVWYAANMMILGRFAPPSQRAALHGLFAALVFGVGGSVGAWAGGLLTQHAGTDTAFLAAAALDFVALLGLLGSLSLWRHRPKGTGNGKHET